jgi:alpha-glucan, water dikinase
LLLQVGNYPGRALGFAAPAYGSDAPPRLLGLPSKRTGLYVPAGGTVIARSDTNGEDLDAFAGAGLYDRWGCSVLYAGVIYVI